MSTQQFVYAIYIATTPTQLWEALTNGDSTYQYWAGKRIQSDWQVGATVKHVKEDGTSDWEGEILHCEPPRLLTYTFHPPGLQPENPSQVQFTLEENGSTVKLTLTHDQVEERIFKIVSLGWTAILSSLKSFLETGNPLVFAAWK